MADLSLVIDPGGVAGVRDGINLQVFPSGSTPLKWQTKGVPVRRTANERLVASSWKTQLDFSTDFFLGAEDYADLQSLIDYNRAAASELGEFEVVVYNLVEPFSEIAEARTRFMVPGTSVISQIAFGGSLYRWTYWVAVQGNIEITTEQHGSFYQVSMEFTEGTRLTSAMEA